MCRVNSNVFSTILTYGNKRSFPMYVAVDRVEQFYSDYGQEHWFIGRHRLYHSLVLASSFMQL
ncbi:MAG: hypothetical protein ACR2KX_16155 [Chitinophagaceae bacterium]